jgi:hypothetical protein
MTRMLLESSLRRYADHGLFVARCNTFIASFGGLWFSLPVDGQMRAFARQGRDVFIAVAVTAGVGIGVSALIAGITSYAN